VIGPRLAGGWDGVWCIRRSMVQRRNLLTLNPMAAGFLKLQASCKCDGAPMCLPTVVMLNGTLESQMTEL
jgi:hypothetical protein